MPASGPLTTVEMAKGSAPPNGVDAPSKASARAPGPRANSAPTGCTKMSTAPSQPNPRPQTVSSSEPVS